MQQGGMSMHLPHVRPHPPALLRHFRPHHLQNTGENRHARQVKVDPINVRCTEEDTEAIKIY